MAGGGATKSLTPRGRLPAGGAGSHAVDVAIQLGHADGGQLVMSLYGHPSRSDAVETRIDGELGSLRTANRRGGTQMAKGAITIELTTEKTADSGSGIPDLGHDAYWLMKTIPGLVFKDSNGKERALSEKYEIVEARLSFER